MADHREMQSFLDAASAAIEGLSSDAKARESLDGLIRALTDIRGLWRPRIQTEESHFAEDRLDAVMDVSEHIELGMQSAQHAQAHSGPDFLVVPFRLHNLSPEERAVMAQSMPPVVTQELVPIAWKDQWAVMKPFLLDWRHRESGSDCGRQRCCETIGGGAGRYVQEGASRNLR